MPSTGLKALVALFLAKSLSEKLAGAVSNFRLSRPTCPDVCSFVRFTVMIGLPRRQNNTAFAQPPTFEPGSKSEQAIDDAS